MALSSASTRGFKKPVLVLASSRLLGVKLHRGILNLRGLPSDPLKVPSRDARQRLAKLRITPDHRVIYSRRLEYFWVTGLPPVIVVSTEGIAQTSF